MKKGTLLKVAELQREIIDPRLSICIYEVSKNQLFEGCDSTEFINFMNLDKNARQLKVKNKQKLKVSYMAEEVKNSLPYPNDSHWYQMFLRQCDIPIDYFSKHNKKFTGDSISPNNKKFKETIAAALVRWKKWRNDAL